MNTQTFALIDHPAAWKAAEIARHPDLNFAVEQRHIDAFDNALRIARSTGLTLENIGVRRLPLDAIGEDITRWKAQLHSGIGMIRLRGLPVERYTVDEWALLYLGLGEHIGKPVSQSNLGDLVGHVINVGGKDRRERAYRNNRALDLHTDRCDYIGMLCLRKARSGGISGYASAMAIHNEIRKTRPELLAPLYNGFKLHRFGEQPPGEAPITEQNIPIFSVADGQPNVIYIRGYIDLAVEEGHYALAEIEQSALDYFDELAKSDEFCFNVLLEPGDAVFTNNCLLLHRRTAFDDYDEPTRRRHLLRLWLSDPDRPAVPGVRAHKTSRGIEKKDDGGTYYQGPGWHSTDTDDGY